MTIVRSNEVFNALYKYAYNSVQHTADAKQDSGAAFFLKNLAAGMSTHSNHYCMQLLGTQLQLESCVLCSVFAHTVMLRNGHTLELSVVNW
jgi:hypothetical protein